MQVAQSVHTLLARKQVAVKASRTVRAILEVQSARLTTILRMVLGSSPAQRKEMRRFAAQNDVKAALPRPLQRDATFVLGT